LDRYRDRALMLQAAAAEVAEMTIVCATPPRAPMPAHPAVTITPLRHQPLRRQHLQALFLSWLWGRRLRGGPTPDILHDTQGFMLPAFGTARASAPGAVRLTSNFASTWDWSAHLRGRWPVEWREREVRYHAQRLGELTMARFADAFTVFGEAHREPAAQAWRVPVERVHALPNCVDPAQFALMAPCEGTAAPTLLFVGSVFRYKGVHELIEAVARLSDRWPTLRLDMVGAMPDGARDAVEGAIANHGLAGRVRLVGTVPRADLPAHMARASAVVLPSYTEGSPRVLIEAMACGRPIVASDIAGVAALDPDDAFIHRVPRFDGEALAKAIDTVLRDPADATRRVAVGRARFEAAHTPQAAGAALAALYRALTS
ncbi:MAG: glycosyltransferase involved in cell wall biosynthesis, partial [Bradymonadia bacterium]